MELLLKGAGKRLFALARKFASNRRVVPITRGKGRQTKVRVKP